MWAFDGPLHFDDNVLFAVKVSRVVNLGVFPIHLEETVERVMINIKLRSNVPHYEQGSFGVYFK